MRQRHRLARALCMRARALRAGAVVVGRRPPGAETRARESGLRARAWLASALNGGKLPAAALEAAIYSQARDAHPYAGVAWCVHGVLGHNTAEATGGLALICDYSSR